MRAIIKLQTGLIRVENPPISAVDIVNDESGVNLSVKIRFAFDATKLANGAGSTVRLELKTRTDPVISSLNVKNGIVQQPSFKSATDSESKYKDVVKSSVVKTLKFNLAKALRRKDFLSNEKKL